MHFGSTKWIVIACSTGIYIGIDKCSGPSISLGPEEIPPPPPLSVGLCVPFLLFPSFLVHTFPIAMISPVIFSSLFLVYFVTHLSLTSNVLLLTQDFLFPFVLLWLL